MCDEVLKAQINELKGYVDACTDAYQEGDGVPFTVMETIQKKVETIALAVRDPVEP